jgi:hypothetical protein
MLSRNTKTKLEFSAFVGFIHKGSVTMHGHTILKVRPVLTVIQLVIQIVPVG